jgi:hypothetical protein
MKKILYSGVGSALLLGLVASPASADVFVLATLTKTKTVNVDVDIFKYKQVTLTSIVIVFPDGAAEALAVANVTNTNNTVDQSIQPEVVSGLVDFDIFRTALIDNSVASNQGIVEVNQDVGNMANQGNALSFSLVLSPGFGGVATDNEVEAEAWVDQVNSGNSVRQLEDPALNPTFPPLNVAPGTPNALATINASILGNSGIVGANQNAGNMANQTNVVAMAVGFGAIVALSEAALGQENTNNSVHEAGVKKSSQITGSINANTGVVHVNQSSGNMANQSNVFALAFVAGGI